MSARHPYEPFRIEVSDLVKHYHHQNILDHLNLTIKSGDLCVLVGDNGAGKTTLLRILASLIRPDQGVVHLINNHPDENLAYRGKIGYVGHSSMFYNDLTAVENLQHYAELYMIQNPREAAEDRIQSVDLTNYKDYPVRTFSRGMQQRLSIARALMHHPSILLFDEPYTGLDQKAAIFLDAQLQNLHQPDRAILIAAHRPQRLLPFATHIAWLQNGKISHHIPIDQIPDFPDLQDYLRGSI
jgi:heme exporter protein A